MARAQRLQIMIGRTQREQRDPLGIIPARAQQRVREAMVHAREHAREHAARVARVFQSIGLAIQALDQVFQRAMRSAGAVDGVDA